MVSIHLKDCITEAGEFIRPHLCNFARHIVHTKETGVVLTKNKIRLESDQFRKDKDPHNIEYLIRQDNNTTDDSRFHTNV